MGETALVQKPESIGFELDRVITVTHQIRRMFYLLFKTWEIPLPLSSVQGEPTFEAPAKLSETLSGAASFAASAPGECSREWTWIWNPLPAVEFGERPWHRDDDS